MQKKTDLIFLTESTRKKKHTESIRGYQVMVIYFSIEVIH